MRRFPIGSQNRDTTRRALAAIGDIAMHEEPKDTPLPATVLFVCGLGVLIVGGWLIMFHLLTVRW